MLKIRNLNILTSFLISIVLLHSFQGGDGSSGNPYQIGTCEQLQNLSNNLASHSVLVSDIDCSSIGNFQRIGVPNGLLNSDVGGGTAFSGVFNGDFHSISNINIDNPSSSVSECWGLFGQIHNARIHNLIISNSKINSSEGGIGLLAGCTVSSKINNISILNSNVISVNQNRVGGITGLLNSINPSIGDPVINSTIFFGNLSGGASYVGGIVGDLMLGSVDNSISSGKISGTHNVGGLIGQSYYYSVNVDNSYSNSDVSSTTNSISVGGLVGGIDSGTINLKNSFFVGNISGSASNPGSLFGYNQGGTLNFQNLYFNNNSNNPSNFVGNPINFNTGSTAIQDNINYFYSASNEPMASWDTNIWNFSGTGLPTLNNLPSAQTQSSPSPTPSPSSSNSVANFPSLGIISASLTIFSIIGFLFFN